MTISLPSDPSLFCKTFDETCDRILQSKQDNVFYTLLARLTAQLRENLLFKDIINQFEAELLAKQNEYSKLSLNAHEYHWKKLWQYHRRSYRHRRELARIKRIITHPREISSDLLHNRLCKAMWEFRYYSPLFRFVELAPMLFLMSQSNMYVSRILFQDSLSPNQRTLRQIMPLKLKMKDKRGAITKKILVKRPERSKHKIKKAEPFSSLFSPLTQELKHKFEIPGHNSYQRRSNMMMMAETDLKFCWDRFQALNHCCNVQSDLPLLQQYPGKWDLIHEKAWHAAWHRCKLEALQYAHRAFCQKLSSRSDDLEAFVSCEMQIHRRDYESFLCSLKNHVHSYLPVLEKAVIDHHKEVGFHPGTLKGNFVIDLAQKFWKINPNGNYDEGFAYYQNNCPYNKQLGEERWKQLVRKHKLDPRTKEAKVRRKGKMTCKN